MLENRSTPPGAVVPTLRYEDVDQAIAWLCGAFGFRERLRTAPEPDGTIHHAQLAVGEGGVILNGQPRGQELNQVPQTVLVRVEDVDGHYERSKQFGALIVNPPASYPFGERQYTAQDLAGNRWTFSQPVADVNPEEWGATVSKIESRVALLPRPRWCYLEIPSVDPRQSVEFYESVFGWKIRGRDSDRPSFEDATGYVSGAWVTGRQISRERGLLPYIWVDDIDATVHRVVAGGGEVLDSPHLPRGEAIATFRDPSGNVIGLYCENPR